MRLIMAVAATLISYLIPPEPYRYPKLTYYSLLSYVGYSLVLYAISRRRIDFSEAAAHRLVWADLAWYTLLTALSHGTNSLFFFFYLFAIYPFFGTHTLFDGFCIPSLFCYFVLYSCISFQ